jgi:hypothetical protein
MAPNAFLLRLKTIKPMQWLILFIFLCVAATFILKESPEAASSAEEARISAILCAIDGAGETRIAVYYENDTPIGAVVVSEGANDIGVRLNLIRAVRTLLGLNQEAVEVFSMRQTTKKEISK